FILTKVGVAALLALGLNVVVGFAGLLDLGYVAFFAVGAYTYALLTGAAKFAVIQYEVSSGKVHGVNPLDYLPHWRPYFWLIAFAIGAAVASLGGVVYASEVGFISPDTFSLFNVAFGSVTILAMVTIGGMAGIAGPIVGAGLIIFLPEYFRFLQDGRLMVFG